MSAAQALASKQFLEAMGPMVSNKQKMQRVIQFIYHLQDDAPCQYTDDEMRVLLAQATEQTKQGQWISHEDLKAEVLSWH